MSLNNKVNSKLNLNKRFFECKKKFTKDRSEENWRECMGAVLQLVHEDGLFFTPCSLNPEDHDRTLIFRLLETPDGKKYFPLFTSQEEALKKNPQDMAAIPVRKLLQEFLKMGEEVKDIWIDCWGDPFIIHRQQAKDLLDEDLKLFKDRSGIYFEKGNIINIPCDCIVNSADPLFNDCGGVDHDIYQGAGEELNPLLDKMGALKLGSAVITPAFNLKQQAIIHTCVPVYDKSQPDIKSLGKSYLSSMKLAVEQGFHSIAFPALGTGGAGFPKEEAANIAVSNVLYFLKKYPDAGLAVILDSYDEEMFNIYRSCIDEINNRMKTKEKSITEKD